MRDAIGIFGGLAGAIVVALVARYGYVTSDTPLDGGIVGFFFAVIAIGGIAGPAVAVHLFRAGRGAGRAWGVVAGIIAAVALLANLSNSLGAIATRADKTDAQRTRAAESVKDDRAELERLIRERGTLPSFTPTTQDAVAAAWAAVNSAEATRAAECGNGDPAQRGKNCRSRETDERERRAELAKALEGKALADRATEMDVATAAVRARLEAAPPVKAANPMAEALSRIFRLPSDLAATGQQVATVVVVEVVVAFALLAFELLAPATPGPSGASLAAGAGPALMPRPRGKGALALVDVPAIDAPLRTLADAASVPRFMLACMARAAGEEVTWGAIYARYVRWCSEQATELTPLALEPFGEQFRACGERARIRTRREGNRVYCIGVKLAS